MVIWFFVILVVSLVIISLFNWFEVLVMRILVFDILFILWYRIGNRFYLEIV